MGSLPDLSQNKTIRILKDAEEGGYGVVASIVYVSYPILSPEEPLQQKIIPRPNAYMMYIQLQHRTHPRRDRRRRRAPFTPHNPSLPLANNLLQWPPRTSSSRRSFLRHSTHSNPSRPLPIRISSPPRSRHSTFRFHNGRYVALRKGRKFAED